MNYAQLVTAFLLNQKTDIESALKSFDNSSLDGSVFCLVDCIEDFVAARFDIEVDTDLMADTVFVLYFKA